MKKVSKCDVYQFAISSSCGELVTLCLQDYIKVLLVEVYRLGTRYTAAFEHTMSQPFVTPLRH